jgi:V/A-type H+/Na+-transporting ATPase subunit I
MAVEQVKRMTILVHKSLQDRVVEDLTRLETVHIEEIHPETGLGQKRLSVSESDDLRELSFQLSKVEFLLDFLKEHRTEGAGFLGSLIPTKHLMSFDEFFAAGDRVDLESTYSGLSEIESKLLQSGERISNLEREREELEHWTGLEVPMAELRSGAGYLMMKLKVASKELDEMIDELAGEAPESAVDVVGREETFTRCVLLYHPDTHDAVSRVLGAHDCEPVELPELEQTPEERLVSVTGEIEEARESRSELQDGIEAYQGLTGDLEILRELLSSRRQRLNVTTSFGETKSIVVVEGWVTEGGLETTREALLAISPEIEVDISDPGEDDKPPVALRNRKSMKQFELLTWLYGLPNRKEYDPTWMVGISFVVFFGFCIGDVGYGLVIIIAFLLMRKYLPLGDRTRKLMLVMVYGGAFAMLFGVLTGSWFGYDPEQLPAFMQSMAVFDPLNEPIPIMGVCMGLGIIHMLAGTAIEFRDNWSARRVADALIDQGLVLFLFIGSIAAAVLVMAGVVPTSSIYVVAIIALGGMVIFMGHKSKSIAGKAFGGLYETYNMLVGWLGDTVSYVRLFALGLATFAVAWVINILAGMVKGIAPVIGILFMIVIILVGHTFNLAVNLLSAVVHPLRLEYVEFFSKFYEDGGDEFKPLAVDSKTIIITDKKRS